MWFAKICSLARGLFARRRVENDMTQEVLFHIEARASDLMSRGIDRHEAHRRARIEFGSVEKYKEETRHARGLRLFDALRGDLRYAVRMARKDPGFAATVIITLALGIGLNTTIFSLFEAVLLRPLAVDNPDQIVSVYTSDFSSTDYGASSYPDYQDFRLQARSLADIAAYRSVPFSMNVGEGTELISAEAVSGSYFSLLRVAAARGRLLTESDDREGAAAVAVISHGLWARRFNNDAGVVGREVQLNGRPFTVIGIADRKYLGADRPFSTDLWISVNGLGAVNPDALRNLNSRESRGWRLIGRLRQGSGSSEAQAEFNLIASRLFASYPKEWRNIQNQGRTISIVAERNARVPPEMGGAVGGFMTLLMVVVGVVLLTACANVANLLLARGATRAREVGVRLALGCGRERLIRQLMTENVLLAVAGGTAGIVLAAWLISVLESFKSALPRAIAIDLQLNTNVLLFTFSLSLLTGVVFSLAPALHAVRKNILPVLKDETAPGPVRRSRLRSAFVVAQIACSIFLLIGAGLFGRSLQRAGSIDVGFDPSNIVVMTLNPTLQGYDEARGRTLYENVIERVSALPGAESVSLALSLPLGLSGSRRGTAIEGYQPRPGEDTETAYNIVAPQYFETMRMPIVRGRSFRDDDGPGSPPVIIVNEAFARRYWLDEDPIGKRVSANGTAGPFREVIGVVRTGKYSTLGEEPRPFYYLPVWQFYRPTLTLHVKTAGDPVAMLPSVRAAVSSIDANVPIFDIKTMDDQMLVPLLPARLAGILLGAFGALAVLLASVGIYGVMAYSVAQRTREIGVRIAVGAQSRDLLRLVFGHALRLIAIGLVFGVSAALALTRLVAFLLYGITPTDPIAFAGAIAVLVSTALLACYVPARRAMRTDPVTALRSE
jgi:predicted permease